MTLTLHLTPLTRQNCLAFQPAMLQPQKAETFTAASLVDYDATLAEELLAPLPIALQDANPSIDVSPEDFDDIYRWFLS